MIYGDFVNCQEDRESNTYGAVRLIRPPGMLFADIVVAVTCWGGTVLRPGFSLNRK
jgi:hypothetical protein